MSYALLCRQEGHNFKVYMVHGSYSPGRLLPADDLASVSLARVQAEKHYRELVKREGPTVEVTYYIVNLDKAITGDLTPSPRIIWKGSQGSSL